MPLTDWLLLSAVGTLSTAVTTGSLSIVTTAPFAYVSACATVVGVKVYWSALPVSDETPLFVTVTSTVTFCGLDWLSRFCGVTTVSWVGLT